MYYIEIIIKYSIQDYKNYSLNIYIYFRCILRFLLIIYFTFFSHTNGRAFSEKGILIIVDYFQLRGHVVKVFLPQHVRRKEFQLIEKMYTDGIVVFTPSRNIAGRQITSYDDR